MASSRTNTPNRRKRPRLENEDGSPSVSSTAAKRRRLKAGGDVADLEEPKGLISTAINGALNFGRRIVSGSGNRAPAKTQDDATADPWEIPDSEEEAGPRENLQLKKTRPANTRKRRELEAGAIYDVPDSSDELDGRTTTPRLTRPRRAASGTGATSEARRKASASASASVKAKAAEKTHEDGAGAGAETPTKRRASRKPAHPMIEEPVELDAEDQGEPKPLPQKFRRRKSPEPQLTVEDTQRTKGILIPLKQNGIRKSKSVVFNSGPGNKKLGETFEEAVSKTAAPTSKPGRGRQKAVQEESAAIEKRGSTGNEDDDDEDDEEDDEVCAICSKPDSKRGNEIVFCDNCDMPVHQKCYGLAVIPEGDWLCRNCSQEDVTSAVGNAKVARVVAREAERPDIPDFECHLRMMQRILLDRCAGRRRIKLIGQDDTYEKAYQLAEQTVVAGEGNSMLIIGARGCGKTTLVESIVSDVSKHHKDQFHVVRLNGFIHTDDKLALREIWRQLGKEMEVEDDLVGKTNNYADTMASLLALLSHPSEIAEAQEGIASKSVIFCIDEFDLFATHARQTLLYNLFDIAQARKAPIAVLGLTTKIDVVEGLEKRVKSRFSHRYVYLSLPKSLPAYWEVCKQGLTIDEDDMAAEGIDKTLVGHAEFWEWWNGKLEALRNTSSFQEHLEFHFHSTKSVSAFLSSCILPLSELSPASPSLRIPGSCISLEPADSKLHVLGALSDLDLSMLIAAARLDIVAHTDTVNFAMAYDEYTSLMGRQRAQSSMSGMMALGGGVRVWGRGTAGMAWERLVTLGMLVPAATVGRGAAAQSGLDAKMWKVDVALEEIPAAVKLNAVLARWCKEI